EPPLRTRPAEVGAAGRLVGRRGEPRVAPAAARAADREHALARHGQVAEELARAAIVDDGADRYFQDEVGTAGAVAVRALPVGSALGVVVAAVVEIEQGRQRGRGFEPDAAAVPAIAAVGTSIRDEFLAAEADAAGTPVAALDENIDLVDEHAVATAGPSGPEGSYAGLEAMLMKRESP